MSIDDETTETRLRLRQVLGYAPHPVAPEEKLGVSRLLGPRSIPVHGLRIPPSPGVSGWYLWAEDRTDDPDFFVPLHAIHLPERSPVCIPYLELPPGWRFVLAPGYEDIWFDERLL